MGNKQIAGLISTPLRIIAHPQGNILHGMKRSDPGYVDFGEAYFSTVYKGEIKAWKKHKLMTLNLIVPEGTVKFVVYDQRDDSPTYGTFNEFVICADNYIRLTIPPGLWFGFKGIGSSLNLVLNIASIPHDPDEVDRRNLDEIKHNWH